MIYITNNNMIIQQYQKLIKVSEKEIIFIHEKKKVYLQGKDLSISLFEKDEFVIHGVIDNLVFKDD